jgi:cyclohexadieny/prephenate dehydrogenase
MLFETVTIVGVGLIGGSIGLAARRRGAARQVIGVGRSQASLERARAVGAIQHGHSEMGPAVGSADLIVFCTPVDRIAQQAKEAAAHCRPGALMTDAGSTKAAIVRDLEGALPPGIHFVGSHPLAGSEKKGVEHARANLFEGRVTVVTPTKASDPGAVEKVIAFWKALGSEVRILDPEAHDRALATTSHLPHLVAAALAGVLPDEWRAFAATGFRDTTRIAAGDPGLWAAIFRQNRAALAAAVRPFGEWLALLLDAIDRDDEARLLELLTQAKQVRDALGS